MPAEAKCVHVTNSAHRRQHGDCATIGTRLECFTRHDEKRLLQKVQSKCNLLPDLVLHIEEFTSPKANQSATVDCYRTNQMVQLDASAYNMPKLSIVKDMRLLIDKCVNSHYTTFSHDIHDYTFYTANQPFRVVHEEINGWKRSIEAKDTEHFTVLQKDCLVWAAVDFMAQRRLEEAEEQEDAEFFEEE